MTSCTRHPQFALGCLWAAVCTLSLTAAFSSSLRAEPPSSSVVSLDGDQWLLATDPNNVGWEEEWFETPRPEAKPTKVPWSIQDAFPGYSGVAWYWREFAAPAHPHPGGRHLLLGPLASLHATDTPPQPVVKVTQDLLNSIHVTPKLIFDPFPAYAQKYLPFAMAVDGRECR